MNAVKKIAITAIIPARVSTKQATKNGNNIDAGDSNGGKLKLIIDATRTKAQVTPIKIQHEAPRFPVRRNAIGIKNNIIENK